MLFTGKKKKKAPPGVQFQPVVAMLKLRSFVHIFSDILRTAKNLDDYVKSPGYIMLASHSNL